MFQNAVFASLRKKRSLVGNDCFGKSTFHGNYLLFRLPLDSFFTSSRFITSEVNYTSKKEDTSALPHASIAPGFLMWGSGRA